MKETTTLQMTSAGLYCLEVKDSGGKTVLRATSISFDRAIELIKSREMARTVSER